MTVVSEPRGSTVEDLQTPSARYEAFAQDGMGQPDRTQNRQVEEYIYSLGNRRAFLFAVIDPKGVFAPSMERREDGRRSAYFTYSRMSPGQLTDVTVDRQSNTRERYVGEMNSLSRMLAPTADPTATAVSKPLFSCLDHGGMLERLRDPTGGDRFALTLFRANAPIRYELDLEHDRLPRRIDGMHDKVVTRFGRDGGGP